jgi:hypothetical protein
MGKLQYLSDYMLKEGAINKAFVSDIGELYIVKGFCLYQRNSEIALIDTDLITPENHRKRVGLPISGLHSHLYDRKAKLSDFKKILKMTVVYAEKK